MVDRLALTRRFQARIAAIGDHGGLLTSRYWQQVGHDEADIAEFARLAAPTFQAVKSSSVAAGNAYYSMLIGRSPAAIGPNDVTLVADPREPFIACWQALKNGHPIVDAIQSGATRAEAVARNLAVSSSRRTGDVVLHRQGLRAGDWTRITDGNACEWCDLVADQTYSTAEAADFGHDRCNCTAVPNIA